jgi:IclR family transcriptional regulator, pca regulon regulatory protein
MAGEVKTEHDRWQDATRPHTIKEVDFVQSLARGLVVIRSFDEEHASQTLSEVAARTHLTRATARRLLLTLADLGYVSRRGREFSLAPGVLDLGYAYLSALGARAVAQTYLERLAETVGESSSMTVLDGTDIVYVARAVTNRIFSLALSIGSRLPAYATSMGRVLLADLPNEAVHEVLAASNMSALTEHTITDPVTLTAELDRVRSQGWCILDQELELGVRSVAAPIKNKAGRVVAAINVSTPVARVTLEDIEGRFLPALLATAEDISSALQKR